MADKRMFSRAIIDSDSFLELPHSSQILYFHLAMRADDDGFVDSPKKIQKMVRASNKDLEKLKSNGYIYIFESGILLILHWHVHNKLQKDRYKKTLYLDEKSKTLLVNKVYCIHDGSELDSQNSLEQSSIDYSIGQESADLHSRTIPSLDDVVSFVEYNGLNVDPIRFYNFYQNSGWKSVKGNSIDWKSKLKEWSATENGDKSSGGDEDPFAQYAGNEKNMFKIKR